MWHFQEETTVLLTGYNSLISATLTSAPALTQLNKQRGH